MDQFKRKKIGNLNVIEKTGSPDGNWVILLHGYGASAEDLAPLANVINAPKGTNWLFPEGEISIPVGPGVYGKAWFPIDVEEFQRAVESGTFRDMTDKRPDGLDSAKKSILKLIEDLGVPKSKIILGGFSQGSMLTVDVALRAKENFLGLALLSSSLLNRSVWKELAGRRSGQKFFQSHGVSDSVLSFEVAKELYDLLDKAGLRGEFHQFNGGHEIPNLVLSALSKFVMETFSQK